MKKNSVLIAMSGGVDSSVAARLLLEQGYNCAGATMKLFDGDSGCCSADDTADARSVAFRLEIPFYVFNFKEEFEKKVISKFIQSYKDGLTPNPCIDCNRYLKFEKFVQRAKEAGFKFAATGHYARVEKLGERYILKKAIDENKDQSYVLYSMTQEQLAFTLFPLGNLTKTQVRELAEQSGFVNAQKKESQDICFVPDGNYARFIHKYAPNALIAGDFVNESGQFLGKHKGIAAYTIGQHKKLGIISEKPLFVKQIVPKENKIVLAEEANIFSRKVCVKNINWICVEKLSEPISAGVKLRYRQKEQRAVIFPQDDSCAVVEFDLPQRAPTPGQAAVFYDGDIVIGGGEIY
jgi:tRNA-specific 2-thiouridylase